MYRTRLKFILNDCKAIITAVPFARPIREETVIHVIRSTLLYGLILGSPGYISGARKAIRFVENLQSELDDWKGSPEHDGLVAKESQFYPKEYHTNVLGNKKIGYVEVPLNHMMIAPGENVEFVLNGNKTTTQQIIDTMIQEAHK